MHCVKCFNGFSLLWFIRTLWRSELSLLLYLRNQGVLEKLNNLHSVTPTSKWRNQEGIGTTGLQNQLSEPAGSRAPALSSGHEAMATVPGWASFLKVPSWDMSLISCWGRTLMRFSLKTPVAFALQKDGDEEYLQNHSFYIHWAFTLIWDAEIVCVVQPEGYSNLSPNCFSWRCIWPQAFFFIFPAIKPVNLWRRTLKLYRV